jgi:plasmid stabilization system protein ParE
MALKIKWTKEARLTYYSVLHYLQEEWSDNEVIDFVDRTDKLILIISKQPYIYKASSYKQIRQAVIGKQNSLFYLVKNEEIILLTFWGNRQNPVKNKYS